MFRLGAVGSRLVRFVIVLRLFSLLVDSEDEITCKTIEDGGGDGDSRNGEIMDVEWMKTWQVRCCVRSSSSAPIGWRVRHARATTRIHAQETKTKRYFIRHDEWTKKPN